MTPARLPRLNWLMTLAGAVIIAVLALEAAWFLRPRAAVTSLDGVDPAQIARLEAAWGIRIANVGVTADGGMVDLRYQVLDADKALGLTDPEGHPVMVDQASGTLIDRGGAHGHGASLRAGSTYYMLYLNPAGVLKPGSRVRLQIGEVVLDNVLVR